MSITCQICGQSFENYRYLLSHIRFKHKLQTKVYYDTYLKLPNEGICPICHKPTNYYKLSIGYMKHCSNKCQIADIENKEKLKSTMLQKYGASNNFIRADIIEKAHSREANEKRRQTNLSRYGVENVAQFKDVQEKSKATNLSRYGVEYGCLTPQCRAKLYTAEVLAKKSQTFFEHYGVYGNLGRREIWQKTADAQLQHYGQYYFNTPLNREKCNNAVARQKSIQTKKKNGSLNSSRYEQDFAAFLRAHHIQYIQEYFDNIRYPYHCDFYLIDDDEFIELNIHWTHCGHWFTDSDKNDIIILDKWKKKALTSNFYKVAIDVWTRRDVEKHECALANHLNYTVVWNNSDYEKLKQQLEEKYAGKK